MHISHLILRDLITQLIFGTQQNYEVPQYTIFSILQNLRYNSLHMSKICYVIIHQFPLYQQVGFESPLLQERVTDHKSRI
jgi:hypothetical protein